MAKERTMQAQTVCSSGWLASVNKKTYPDTYLSKRLNCHAVSYSIRTILQINLRIKWRMRSRCTRPFSLRREGPGDEATISLTWRHTWLYPYAVTLSEEFVGICHYYRNRLIFWHMYPVEYTSEVQPSWLSFFPVDFLRSRVLVRVEDQGWPQRWAALHAKSSMERQSPLKRKISEMILNNWPTACTNVA